MATRCEKGPGSIPHRALAKYVHKRRTPPPCPIVFEADDLLGINGGQGTRDLGKNPKYTRPPGGPSTKLKCASDEAQIGPVGGSSNRKLVTGSGL